MRTKIGILMNPDGLVTYHTFKAMQWRYQGEGVYQTVKDMQWRNQWKGYHILTGIHE